MVHEIRWMMNDAVGSIWEGISLSGQSFISKLGQLVVENSNCEKRLIV